VKRKISPADNRTLNPGHETHNLVAILTELPRFQLIRRNVLHHDELETKFPYAILCNLNVQSTGRDGKTDLLTS
jgi:hypothetical protein